MAFDNVCKILAEKYPTDFARWLLPDKPRKVKVLKTELSIEPIRADSVTFLQTENRILHLEFQTTPKSETPLPLRMLDYNFDGEICQNICLNYGDSTISPQKRDNKFNDINKPNATKCIQ